MFCRIVRDQPPIKFVTLSKKIIKRANELVYIGEFIASAPIFFIWFYKYFDILRSTGTRPKVLAIIKK